MAEFAMVSAFMALTCLLVLQLTLAAYVRATLIDCAGMGARHGALYGSSLEEGAARAAQAASATLGPRFATQVSAHQVPGGDGPVVQVVITAPLPLVGLLGPRSLTVRGHAVQEVG